MPVNNNTTQLNMSGPKNNGTNITVRSNSTNIMAGKDFGVIGQRNFSDYSAKQISAEISRNEYRKAIVSDERMQQFRQAVYKMVSGWALEDKVAIITEYGDIGFLNKYGKNPREEIVNRVCTESIIIHLDPADLRQLYNDIGIKEKKLVKEIDILNDEQSQARKRLPRRNKSFFLNTLGFEDVSKFTHDSRNAAQYRSYRKLGDSSYNVPDRLVRQYNTLRNELNDVLKTCYNKIEIQNMAIAMGIEIPEGAAFVKIRRWIINKTCLYVDLIVGKGRKTYAGAFMDPKPFNALLKMTSYSYVTGEPGLDPKEFNELKKKARRAQVAVAERMRMQNYKTNKTKDADFAALTGGKTGSFKKMSRNLKRHDSGILQDATYEQLAVLAGKYGIDPTMTMNKDVGVLKTKIYSAMAQETKRVRELEKTKRLRERSGRSTREVDDLLSIHSGFSTESILGKKQEEEKNEPIPIIHFRSNGSLIEKKILSAVPVYLVGQGGAGTVGDIEKFFQKNLNRPDVAGPGSVPKPIEGDITFDKNKATYLKMFKHLKKNVRASHASAVTTLSPEDQALYNRVKSLPFKEPSGDATTGSINSIISLFNLLKNNYGVDSVGIENILRQAGVTDLGNIDTLDNPANPDHIHLDKVRLMALYAYALLSNKNKLASYLQFTESIHMNIRDIASKGIKNRFRKFKKNFMPKIKNLASAGLAVARVFTSIVKTIKETVKWPMAETDLKPDELSIYQALKGKSLPELISLIRSSIDIHRPYFDAFDRKYAGSPWYENALRALIALSMNKTQAYRLFLAQEPILFNTTKKKLNSYGKKIVDELKGCCDKGGLIGSLLPGARTITNIFRSTKTFKKTLNENYDEQKAKDKALIDNTFKKYEGIDRYLNVKTDPKKEEDEFDPRKNAGQRFPIPKLEWCGKPYRNSEIIEVVPVYVVNAMANGGPDGDGDSSGDGIDDNGDSNNTDDGGKDKGGHYNKLGWGSGAKNSKNNGIRNMDITLMDYGRKFGMDTIDENKYLIKLKDPADKSIAERADGFVGRRAKDKSKFPMSGWYKPTKETIAWAIENDLQFGNGGVVPSVDTKQTKVAVVGDNPKNNGKEHKELVVQQPDGELSVHPINKFFKNIRNKKTDKTTNIPSLNWSGKDFTNKEITEVIPIYMVNHLAQEEFIKRNLKEANKIKAAQESYIKNGRTESTEEEADDGKISLSDRLHNLKNNLNDKLENKLSEIAAKRKEKKENKPGIFSKIKNKISNSKFGKAFANLTKKKETEDAAVTEDTQSSSDNTSENKEEVKKHKHNEKVFLKDLRMIVKSKGAYLSPDTRAMGINKVLEGPVMPVFVTNDYANGDDLQYTLLQIADIIDHHFTDLKMGLANEVVSAPYGVGAINRPMMMKSSVMGTVVRTAGSAINTTGKAMVKALGLNTGGEVTRAYSGGDISAKGIHKTNKIARFATGGASVINKPAVPKEAQKSPLSVITGDASNPNNIFSNGAKPELVQSNSDIKVTPLNKTGTEKTQKISRMTPEERSKALATAISSHVIKYKYKLPNGAEDVSNVGEAIKVFDVRPGISDQIEIGDKSASLIEIIAGIYKQLVDIGKLEAVNGELLATMTGQNLQNKTTVITPSNQNTSAGGNPFATGFPSSLDNILGGN